MVDPGLLALIVLSGAICAVIAYLFWSRRIGDILRRPLDALGCTTAEDQRVSCATTERGTPCRVTSSTRKRLSIRRQNGFDNMAFPIIPVLTFPSADAERRDQPEAAPAPAAPPPQNWPIFLDGHDILTLSTPQQRRHSFSGISQSDTISISEISAAVPWERRASVKKSVSTPKSLEAMVESMTAAVVRDSLEEVCLSRTGSSVTLVSDKGANSCKTQKGATVSYNSTNLMFPTLFMSEALKGIQRRRSSVLITVQAPTADEEERRATTSIEIQEQDKASEDKCTTISSTIAGSLSKRAEYFELTAKEDAEKKEEKPRQVECEQRSDKPHLEGQVRGAIIV